MGSELIIPLIMRWAHILAAIVAIGGAFYVWAILSPAAKSVLEPETRQKLRAELSRRWKMIVHISILLFLVSGFYNYLAVTRFRHPDQPLYHALFGIKFLLALVVFFLATALTSRGAGLAKFRDNPGRWLPVLLVLALLVVLIAGVMRTLPGV